MTHTSTDQERAEFEAAASNNGKWPQAIERDAKGDYLLMETASGWRWWQETWLADRRAPVVPQGWKLVPDKPTADMLIALMQWDSETGLTILPQYKAMLAAAPQPPEGLMSEKRTTKPETAPVQMQMPVPVAYVHVPSLAWGGKVRPVVSFEKYEDDHKDGVYSIRTPLYTEHQVRQLLADHGIK